MTTNPLHDPLDRTLVIAGAMLAASLGSYSVARALDSKRTAKMVNTAQDS